nr:MAG TPA: hypothetical protein [Caudoviricetes sp.]
MIQGVSTQYSSGRTLSFKAHCTLHCSFSHFEHFGNLSLEFQTDFNHFFFFFHTNIIINCYFLSLKRLPLEDFANVY